MHRFSKYALLCGILMLLATGVQAMPADEDVPFVRLHTEEGLILVALFPDLAPYHVANFLHLASTEYYEETYFHRIMENFMIQGGCPNTLDFDPRNDGQGNPKLSDVVTPEESVQLESIAASLAARGYVGLDVNSPVFVKAEFSQTAKHLRGTLSMARRARPVDSAGSQFFLCHERSSSVANLDGQYTVFGHVVVGLEVIDTIITAEKDPKRGADQPAIPVKIVRTEVSTGVASLSAEEQTAFRNMVTEIEAAGSTW